MKFDRLTMIEALRRVVKRLHYPLEVMLVCVRWCRFPFNVSLSDFQSVTNSYARS